jgi:hypothetical protein
MSRNARTRSSSTNVPVELSSAQPTPAAFHPIVRHLLEPAMRLKSVLLSLSAVAALSSNAVEAFPLVANGTFESTTNGTNKQLSSSPNGDANRSTLAGWTSSNGNDGGYNFVLDSGIITTGASAIGLKTYASATAHGNVFASDALYYPGTLSQTVGGLAVGASYLLTFDYALGQQAGFDGANLNNYWKVGLGDTTVNAGMLSIDNGGFSGWKTASLTFTATRASEVLSFLAASNSPGAPPFMLLDNVSMQAAVPEPSTLSLMLGGVGLAACLARRRKTKA